MIQNTIIAKLSEHHQQLISATIEDIKQQIFRPEIMQQHIQALMVGETGAHGHEALPESKGSTTPVDQTCTDSLDRNSSEIGVSAIRIDREILLEVYVNQFGRGSFY